MDKISINWDVSGVNTENIYDLMAFCVNKFGKCKNESGVVFNRKSILLNKLNDGELKFDGFVKDSLENPDDPLNLTGTLYNMHDWLGTSNKNSSCVDISFNFKEIPLYVKEIFLFAVCRNGYKKSSFSDLDFFNVFLNNEIIYSLDYDVIYKLNKDDIQPKIFNIGNFVRNGEDFEFIEKMEFMVNPEYNLVSLGKEFDINFIETENNIGI